MSASMTPAEFEVFIAALRAAGWVYVDGLPPSGGMGARRVYLSPSGERITACGPDLHTSTWEVHE